MEGKAANTAAETRSIPPNLQRKGH
jgi:hypothetical protein